MGARALELPHSYSVGEDGAVKLHVAQLPPNPALFVPGPAVLCVLLSLSLSPSLGRPDLLLSLSLSAHAASSSSKASPRSGTTSWSAPASSARSPPRPSSLCPPRLVSRSPTSPATAPHRRLRHRGASRSAGRAASRPASSSAGSAASSSSFLGLSFLLLRLSLLHRHSRLYLRLINPLQPLSPTHAFATSHPSSSSKFLQCMSLLSCDRSPFPLESPGQTRRARPSIVAVQSSRLCRRGPSARLATAGAGEKVRKRGAKSGGHGEGEYYKLDRVTTENIEEGGLREERGKPTFAFTTRSDPCATSRRREEAPSRSGSWAPRGSRQTTPSATGRGRRGARWRARKGRASRGWAWRRGRTGRRAALGTGSARHERLDVHL